MISHSLMFEFNGIGTNSTRLDGETIKNTKSNFKNIIY